MNKGMILALFACFFGAAATAACDPADYARPPVDLVPTLGSGDDVAGSGDCSKAQSEQACSGTLMCVWSNDRCAPMSLASAP